MTTTTMTVEEMLDFRVLASAMQSIRQPDESFEEAAARWKASTTKDERAATLSAHRAAIEQAAAEAHARAAAEEADRRAKARDALLADVDAACSTLRPLLERCPSEPGHGALLVALDRRQRWAA